MNDHLDSTVQQSGFNTIRSAGSSTNPEFVLTGLVDINGSIRGKAFRREAFEKVIEKGFPMTDLLLALDPTDTPITDYQKVGVLAGAPDLMVFPDMDTYRDLTWKPGWKICLCETRWPDGRRCELGSRELLQKAINDLSQKPLGYKAKSAFEYEIRIFNRQGQPLSNGISYSLGEIGNFEEFIRQLTPAADALGIDIDAVHTEAGPGLLELNLAARMALEAADNAALLKFAVKSVAKTMGLRASFMAKPIVGQEGSSGHVHFSYWKVDANAFASEEKSVVAQPLRWAVGGILKHLSAASLFLNPNINSYKRVIPGWFAPVNVSWGVDNRSTALRAIVKEDPALCRLECRRPGADVNPYLALAALVFSANAGFRQQIEPPPEIRGDAYGRSELARLPESLEAAIQAFCRDTEFQAALGQEFSDYYITSRKWELKAWQNTVTDWELSRYDNAV